MGAPRALAELFQARALDQPARILVRWAEEDATGEGRLLLWDRNWTVVEQDPPAGTAVTEDQTIILRSKKDDE